MSAIGLDFGTTTSILSYQVDGKIQPFALGGASASPYIPSVLSIEKLDNTIDIGQAARLNQGDDDYWVYSHFKMLLAETDSALLAARGYEHHSPADIARQYIEYLLARFYQETGIHDIENLVVTVPEIWVREGQHAARETLKNILLQLGFPQARLVSEPVAASVYFAHQFKLKQGYAYQGHVLVCDYGGGTLDLSLSLLGENTIKVLEGTGCGHAEKHLGIAGVAFDEAVIEHLLQKNGESIENPRRRYKLQKAFEEQKIAQTDKLNRLLEQYRRNPVTNKKLFEIEEITIETQDLVNVFDRLLLPELQKSLSAMDIFLKKYAIDTENAEQFHILMVGGFSNFYLVRRAVRDFFHSKTDADVRFTAYFDLTDTALAIAKGAALLATNAFQLDLLCPINVGIRAKNQFLVDTDILLLNKGTPLSQYQQPTFFQHWLAVMSEQALNNLSLQLFLDIGEKRRYINLQGKLRDFIPNPHPQNQWRVGFAVDENTLFTLHIIDKSGVEKITPLGNLAEKMGGLHIVETTT
ncbi:Hsp70 family protein [Beggiatoa leptomitoformis]|uniref:Hsp70 family protein n=1 Tax=Beggiatoa leptomitoformis TaxID=288004 RepID=A0A2N9YEF7_9GAMM|nr:Hsp70 family protein [Beggiatoa leptomitoformis]ALG68780.1 Hsp70 family protein [Beggiatoa leptomitoformis]AUI68860.1 Hsp70 family protein [Beggiatoa leptomitoformis]